ncbi:MAG: phenylacetate--CoA ligase family protein, partial [Myxococcota bacterium]
MSLSRDRILAIQAEKLATLLATVADTNPFYRRKLAAASASELAETTVDRLVELPFTTKDDLVRDQRDNPPYGTNLSYPLDCYVRLHNTTGTTGRPLRWLDTSSSWSWFVECWRQILEEAGVRADDRVFLAFSFGPFIGFWGAFEAAQKIGALTLTGGALSTEQRLEQLFENRATVLVSTPTYALRLAEVARHRGIDLASSDIRLTIHAGEPGASVPNVKLRIEESWGATCIDHA